MPEQHLKEKLHEAIGKANARPCHANDLTVSDLQLTILKVENRRLKKQLEAYKASQ